MLLNGSFGRALPCSFSHSPVAPTDQDEYCKDQNDIGAHLTDPFYNLYTFLHIALFYNY